MSDILFTGYIKVLARFTIYTTIQKFGTSKMFLGNIKSFHNITTYTGFF